MRQVRFRTLLLIVAIVTVFLLDTFIPLGYVGGLPYVALIPACLWYKRSVGIMLAGLFTCLTIAGFFASPPPLPDTHWVIVLNRVIAIIGTWTSMYVVQRFYTLQQRIQQVHKDYDDMRTELDKLAAEIKNRI